MLEEDKIQDIFVQTSLENEDWLEPPKVVFENIKGAIYKKKRKRWYLLLLVPFIGAIVFYTYYKVYNNQLISNSKSDTSTTQTTNVQITAIKPTDKLVEQNENTNDLNSEAKANEDTFNLGKTEKSIKPLIEKADKNIEAEVSLKSNFSGLENNNSSKKAERQFNNINPFSKNKEFLSYKKNSATINIVDESLNEDGATISIPNNEITNAIINKSTFSAEVKDVVFLNKSVDDEIQTVERHKNLMVNKSIDKLPSILSNLSSTENNHNILPKTDNKIATLLNGPITNWSISAVSGLSYWDYSLNKKYKTELQALNFKYTNSTGYFISLEAQKKLNKKFSIIGAAAYETVFCKSGHNATINYNPVNENLEGISTYGLKMASTFGAIDANVEILRQNDINIDSMPVTIDINNEHRISSIDLSTYLSAKIINFNNTTAAVRFGFGMAQIINIKNELASFSTSTSTLKPFKAEIANNKTELNKTRFFIAFGSNLAHQVNATNSLFINYSFKSDLNALFISGEFSSFLNKHNIGLGYQKRF